MYGYKISFKGLPENLFACSTTVNNYDWHNRNGKNVIEFSVSKSDEITMIINNEEKILHNTMRASCLPGDDLRKAFCKPETQIEITSVAVSFDELNVIACDLSRNDALDNSVFVISAVMYEESEITEILRLLNKYISCTISEMAYDRAQRISVWFEILSCFDKATRKMLMTQNKAVENYYVNKLNYIIKTNYHKNVSLTGVAKEFGISAAYLSWVYSETTGHTFSNALLTFRMEKVKEFVLTTDMSASEIARKTGFCDETYLRKRFKKFFGVCMSEYKNINRGLTLYHDKPLRIDDTSGEKQSDELKHF